MHRNRTCQIGGHPLRLIVDNTDRAAVDLAEGQAFAEAGAAAYDAACNLPVGSVARRVLMDSAEDWAQSARARGAARPATLTLVEA
jgi:hypothetical protein